LVFSHAWLIGAGLRRTTAARANPVRPLSGVAATPSRPAA